MTYSQMGDKVTLEMTLGDYTQLLMMLGFALGARDAQEDRGGFYRWLAFVNDLNTGNPNFVPYKIPDGGVHHDSTLPSGL